MTYTITVTALPSCTFGSDEPEVLPEPRKFKGFRSPTDQGRWGRGNVPEVVLFDPYRHVEPRSWATREAAERNLARLTERGYIAHIPQQDRFITVCTRDSREALERYLYGHTRIISHSQHGTDYHHYLLVTTTTGDVDYKVGYQCDRLNSGWGFGAKVHQTQAEAEAYLASVTA